MKLDIESIGSVTSGAVRIEENENGVSFFRFTKAQEKYYEEVSRAQERSFYDRALATAGIRLSFQTDGRALKIKGATEKRTSRQYYAFDIFVNGSMKGSIDNFSRCELPESYIEHAFPLGEFSGEIELGEGTKEVCVYFPWSVSVSIKEISVDGASFVKPLKRSKRLLAFGDSITQGYDALRPSMRYASRLSDMLCAEEINKGIGGEFFVPALARLDDGFSPDYITVAYGTNDWSQKEEADFKVRCKEFFEALGESYPKSKLFVITPIWRADMLGERRFGKFENVELGIRDAISGSNNAVLIRGIDLVGHSENNFADKRLHPNDEGFRQYSDNLYKAISKYL